MNPFFAIGADVGGSHISSAVCNISQNICLSNTLSLSHLDNKAYAEEIIRIWGATLTASMSASGKDEARAIGFAMPGPFEYDKGIARMTHLNNKYENIYGLNVAAALRHSMQLAEDFPIRFINDATAFALGEHFKGNAMGSRSSLSITLGTGFGSAFLKDGIPVVQGSSVPKNGCLWHLPFENGIGDDYFSTRGFVKRAFEKTGIKAEGVKELSELAGHNPEILKLFHDFGTCLGEFLFPWVQKAEVEVLVLGGNIANAFRLFGTSLQNYFISMKYPLKIKKSDLGETASIIGSARLGDDEFYETIRPLLPLM